MINKFIISLSILLVTSLSAISQYYYGGLSSSFNMPGTQYMVDSTGKLLFKPGDVGFSMQLGTGYSSNFHGGSSVNTFVSPSFAYNVSTRFRLKAGVTISNNFGDPYLAGYDYYYSPVINPGTITSVFVTGDYLLGNKLMLSGTLYKDFSSFNTHITDPRYKIPESQGMILNLNYRPTQHFEINASFEYGNGYRSMFQNPFYRNGMFPGESPWGGY